MKNKKNIPLQSEEIQRREGSLSIKEDDVIELSFSSEEPYLRSYGYEVLSHDEGAIDLTRLNEIGVVLFNHDKDQVIGRIKKAWIEDRKGKALIQFDEDEDSLKIKNKVKSGTLKGVSVGYSVSEWFTKESKETDINDTWIAKKWMPFEISIVSIPADPSVGVGRSLEESSKEDVHEEQLETKNKETKDKKLENFDKIETTVLIKEISNMPKEEQQQELKQLDERSIIENERSRIADITSMCRDFNIESEDLIKSGASVDQARSKILDELKVQKKPLVTNVKDETDNFKSAAIDAILLRSGLEVQNPSKGASELRSLNLRDLAIESLARDPKESRNKDQLRRLDHNQLFDEIQRSYFNPSAVFPAIMDSALNKKIVEIYKKAPTTFEAWTSKGSVSDFKETKEHNYLLGGGSFQKVNENGELKASAPSTEILPTRKIETYGAQFTMTRQAFINDDIGFLNNVPQTFALAAKRLINKQCYEVLFNNKNFVDGKALFHADHGNLVATGAAPSLATINALMLKLQTQKDPFGEPLNIIPRMLVLPVGYGMEVATLLHSSSITTTESNNTGYNPLADKGLVFVEDATLNALAGSSACPFFMVADPSSAKGVQVDYLNGVEVPTIRRSEKAGQLGVTWDIFLDWGVNLVDFRGLAKNNGVKLSI